VEAIEGGLSSLEFDREDTGLEVAAPDVGEARQDAEHRPIVGQDICSESAQAAGLGRGEQGVEQKVPRPRCCQASSTTIAISVAPSASPGS
jgi:hypothetical protein